MQRSMIRVDLNTSLFFLALSADLVAPEEGAAA